MKGVGKEEERKGWRMKMELRIDAGVGSANVFLLSSSQHPSINLE